MSDPVSPDSNTPAPLPQPPFPSQPPRPVGVPPTAARPKKSSTPVLFIGCGAFVLLAIGGTALIAGAGASASVDDGAVLKVTLSGEIPEYVQSEGLDELFGAKPVTINQHVFNLKKAAADKRIKGVVVELAPLAVGPAKIEELRDALVAFKKSGKFVIAWSEFMTEREYSLAIAADKIVRRGQTVTLIASAGGIRVRAPGRALGDGAQDERVRVQNLSSLKVVEGVVENASSVRVAP